MSINSISQALSSRIAKELSLSDDRREIIQYGLVYLLSQLLTIVLLLIVAYALKITNEVIILALCSALLRKYSGGAHCSSPLRCSLLSIVTVLLLVLLSKCIYSLNPIIIIAFVVLINLLSVTIYFIYAPQDTPSKPIRNARKKKILKTKSVIISIFMLLICTSLLYFNFIYTSILISLGSFNQALTLTKPGKVYVNFSDRILKFLPL